MQTLAVVADDNVVTANRRLAAYVGGALLLALPYLASGPGWVREDWYFLRHTQHGGLPTGWFGVFRPLAEPVHVVLFGLLASPIAILLAQSVLVGLTAWLFEQALGRWFDRSTAMAAGVMWLVLPIHQASGWWASGFYITAATALALQSLRSDERGTWWLLAAGLTYEATVAPLALVAVWRRQWGRAAVAAACTAWSFITFPIDARWKLVSVDTVMRGSFGLGLSSTLGALVLAVAVLWFRRDRAVQVGLGLVAAGIAPNALNALSVSFVGLGDRGLVVAAFGVALVLARLSGGHRFAVAALAALTVLAGVNFGQAADDAADALRCADRGVVRLPAGSGDVESIARFLADDAVLVATAGRITDGQPGPC